MKLEEAKKLVEAALDGATSPAVLVSFGKDSLLLLYLARQVKPDISIIWFKQRASKALKRFAECIILEWNLSVFSFMPSSSYFLPNDEGLTLIDEHSFSGVPFPLLTDTKDGEECAVNLRGEQTPFFPCPFDVTLIGWKATDEHFVLGKNPFPQDGFQLGNTKLYAPLRDLTDEEVLRAIQDLQIPYEEIDDSLSICTRCLRSNEPVYCPEVRDFISPVQWQPEERLREFRARFQGGNNQGHGLSP